MDHRAARRSSRSPAQNLPRFEIEDGRLKINPLGDWTKDDLDAYFAEHDLPRHPLEAQGYLSVGCQPCTSKVAPGEDPRAGRWRGWDKTECGIHAPAGTAGRRRRAAAGLRAGVLAPACVPTSQPPAAAPSTLRACAAR